MLILGVALGEDVLERGGAAVVEVWRRAVELEERGGIVGALVLREFPRRACADVVHLEGGVERRGVAGGAGGLLECLLASGGLGVERAVGLAMPRAGYVGHRAEIGPDRLELVGGGLDELDEEEALLGGDLHRGPHAERHGRRRLPRADQRLGVLGVRHPVVQQIPVHPVGPHPGVAACAAHPLLEAVGRVVEEELALPLGGHLLRPAELDAADDLAAGGIEDGKAVREVVRHPHAAVGGRDGHAVRPEAAAGRPPNDVASLPQEPEVHVRHGQGLGRGPLDQGAQLHEVNDRDLVNAAMADVEPLAVPRDGDAVWVGHARAHVVEQHRDGLRLRVGRQRDDGQRVGVDPALVEL